MKNQVNNSIFSEVDSVIICEWENQGLKWLMCSLNLIILILKLGEKK